MAAKYKIVDLFSGCGGFGLGAKQAGFDVVVAVDIDPVLQSSYKQNFPNARVLNGDLSVMDTEAWRLVLSNESIDGVIGGPPCQGYSRIGKNEADDPRRSLLRHFFRTVNIIQPKFFVMENVEGLLDAGNVEELNKAVKIVDKRYKVLPATVVDAHEFGVPTKRKRVVVIGYDPKEMAAISVSDIIPKGLARVTVKDAISDISPPIAQKKDKEDYGWAAYRKIKSLSDYAEKMRALPPKTLGWNVAIEKLQSGQASGHFDTTHTEAVKARYVEIKQGETDKISRSKKLAWNGVCPTLRAGTGADKGSYQAVRPLHPSESRVITVREGARLQGFPDWFCFHRTKWHSFRMLGNSVSPIVAESILSVIKSKLRKNSETKQASDLSNKLKGKARNVETKNKDDQSRVRR
ncbi:MAG: DNA cytosine methyltransferase [Sideroxyarcus sp.]|nr:DNA cytosine methyltransferase [Sideroxyarcus sp.]